METYGYTNGENLPIPAPKNQFPYRSEKKIPAALLAILIGYFGIHKFYMGYNTEGIILLVSTLVLLPIFTMMTCGLGAFAYPIVVVVPLVEGIIYLTMSDEQFDYTYLKNRKPWF